MPKMIVLLRSEYDDLEVKVLKTLTRGSEFQIRMGRENELLILSLKALNSLNW